jgi:hypothetical protein
MTLEERFKAAERRASKPTKLQAAFNALRDTRDDVSAAKVLTAKQGISISARTWAKAITARTVCSPVPVLPTPYKRVNGSLAPISTVPLVPSQRAIPENVLSFRKSLWTVACLAQDTDPKSSFVIFADDNEAAKAYNTFALAITEAIEKANATGMPVIIYQSKVNPLNFGTAHTLPMHATRIGDPIRPTKGGK